jgi:hypothetical protein
MQIFDPSNEPNRPHISSDTRDFKERRDKINQDAPYIVRRAPPQKSLIVVHRVPSGSRRLAVWRPARAVVCPSAPPVKGYLRFGAGVRNPFFPET